MTTVGYVRVSATDQNLAAQKEAVKKAGATKLFQEKESGAKVDREQLKACLSYLREGDTLVCTRVDRLARSTRHLLEIVEDLKDRGVILKFTEQPELNPSDTYGELMVTILGAIAKLERTMIRERQAAGIKEAKKRIAEGDSKQKPFGRPAKLTSNVAASVQKLRNEGLSVEEIMNLTKLSKSSVYSALKMQASVGG